MTNAELKKHVDVVKEHGDRLRTRVGELTDEVTVLKQELKNTQKKVQQDMRRLVAKIEERATI